MAGKVQVQLTSFPSYMELTPFGCPAQGPRDSDPPAYEPVRCMSYSQAFGPRYCPFYVFTARDTELKQRVSTPIVLAAELDSEGQQYRFAHVCCQLAKGAELNAGA